MNRLFPLLFALLLLPACRQSYTPRPYGYFRVTLPPHAYVPVQDDALPFRFDRSALAEVRPRPAQGDGLWLDLYYPRLNADIHCSYKPVRGNLRELSEDARRFVYAHSDRADDISEHLYEHPDRHVYGLLYDLKGNVASPVQFTATDTSSFTSLPLHNQTRRNKSSACFETLFPTRIKFGSNAMIFFTMI